MASVWMQDRDGWAVLPLDPSVSGYELLTPFGSNGTVGARALEKGRRNSADETQTVRVFAVGAADNETWVLLCEPGAALVNAEPLTGGCRVLRDRDEIRVRGGDRAFFSTEAEVCITSYPGEDRPTCPRCKVEIDFGSPAIRCPSCRIWYHQGDTECFTYRDTCATCSQPSAIGGGLRWWPEGL